MAFSYRKKKKAESPILKAIREMREANFEKLIKSEKEKAKELQRLKKKYGIKPKENI